MIIVFFGFSLFAQNATQSAPQTADNVQNATQTAPQNADNPQIFQNKNKFIVLNQDFSVSETLKTYYAYFYDGEYTIDETQNDLQFAILADGLYLQYYKKSELTVFPQGFENQDFELNGFWLPCSNLTDISLSPARRKDKLLAYLILQNEKNTFIYEIDYWKTEQDYKVELASIDLTEIGDFLTSADFENNAESDKIAETGKIDETGKIANSVPNSDLAESDNPFIAKVEKYIQIGDTVYTSTVGSRTKIRNPRLIAQLPQNPLLNEEKNILVLGSPNFTKVTNIEDSMLEEIKRHNSIIYPPRFSVLEMKEPSIYKLLENML